MTKPMTTDERVMWNIHLKNMLVVLNAFEELAVNVGDDLVIGHDNIFDVAVYVANNINQACSTLMDEYIKQGAIYGNDHNGLMRWIGETTRIAKSQSEIRSIKEAWERHKKPPR